ncbi:hypothetical protein RHSIM_Rhsim08G0198500 [Rhododendron simsii]|uniref:CRAL-TRIO domain-containing protein n=1 Tax=Rhododendron simsii TaxID=118357 RepID=A0A834LGR6_RHOSS|nr:hypothetical protein RHSIM_Rhsim08G0198500 [Rhododendron simsii]
MPMNEPKSSLLFHKYNHSTINTCPKLQSQQPHPLRSPLTCVTPVPDNVSRYHADVVGPNQCYFVVTQQISTVWLVVRCFDNPQAYKHFVESYHVVNGDGSVSTVRDGWIFNKLSTLLLLLIKWPIQSTNAEEPAAGKDEDTEALDVDDFMIRRFLRARDLDIEKASAMFLKYLKWKRTFVPTGSISASEIATDLGQNKVFTQGSDKTGRPIMVVFSGRHFPRKGGLEEFKQGQEKFAVIGDMEGWGYANSDVRAYLGALTILQDYHPERLGKLFLIHVPYIFMAVWKAVYPFIDDNTKKKIIFVDNKKMKSTLLEDIDESQLPEIYGGKLQLVPVQDS